MSEEKENFFVAKVISGYRITIDPKMREELELEEGDFVVVKMKKVQNE